MVNDQKVHIIMPVKDSIETAEQALRALQGQAVTVWNDNSTPENTHRLHEMTKALGFACVDIASLTDHPSPNYRLVLIESRKKALADNAHLVIVESDVLVKADTISSLCAAVQPGVGMVAAVTTDEQGQINFPYEYARRIHADAPCRKRFSFCCSLLTNAFLQAYDFEQLDPAKNWYDVHISHMALQLGFENILQVTNPVLHKPHSSRPWKQLKYTHPLLYYWRKMIHGRDKI